MIATVIQLFSYSLWECPAGHRTQTVPTDAGAPLYCGKWSSGDDRLCGLRLTRTVHVEAQRAAS